MYHEKSPSPQRYGPTRYINPESSFDRWSGATSSSYPLMIPQPYKLQYQPSTVLYQGAVVLPRGVMSNTETLEIENARDWLPIVLCVV